MLTSNTPSCVKILSVKFLNKTVDYIFGGKIIQGGTGPLKFLSKKLPGETLCKFFPIFPPKVLVYMANYFDDTFVMS